MMCKANLFEQVSASIDAVLMLTPVVAPMVALVFVAAACASPDLTWACHPKNQAKPNAGDCHGGLGDCADLYQVGLQA